MPNEGSSLWLANKRLSILRGGDLAYPATGLSLVQTTDIPVDGAFTQLAAGGYTPIQLDIDDWTIPSNRQIKNAVELEYGPATAPWNIRGVAIIDDAGNVWFYGVNNSGTIVEGSDYAYYDIDDLVFSETQNPQYQSEDWANRKLSVLKGNSLNPPPFIKIKLLAKPPDGSNAIHEITAAGYEPLQVPCDAANWLTPTTRFTHNLLPLEFKKLESDAPQIRGFAICADDDSVMWTGVINPNKAAYKKWKLIIPPEKLIVRD